MRTEQHPAVYRYSWHALRFKFVRLMAGRVGGGSVNFAAQRLKVAGYTGCVHPGIRVIYRRYSGCTQLEESGRVVLVVLCTVLYNAWELWSGKHLIRDRRVP